jgi:hypothetical protein
MLRPSPTGRLYIVKMVVPSKIGLQSQCNFFQNTNCLFFRNYQLILKFILKGKELRRAIFLEKKKKKLGAG